MIHKPERWKSNHRKHLVKKKNRNCSDKGKIELKSYEH